MVDSFYVQFSCTAYAPKFQYCIALLIARALLRDTGLLLIRLQSVRIGLKQIYKV